MRYTLDSSFLTGCGQVDSQHKQLFDAINSLVDACEQNKGGEELQKSLNFLSDYTVKHFFDEEQLLKKYGFSGFANHHQYHEAFKKTVKDLAHEFILKGASADLVQEVEKKIGSWLVEHIKGQDFRWAKELKEKAPELFDAKAFSAGTLPAAPPLSAPARTAVPASNVSANVSAAVNGRYVMDSSFLTGCDPVDIQHGQLFEAINGLLDTCKKGVDREKLQKSLEFLSNYTVKHFFDEEQLLKKHGFSGFANHHQYHEAFKKTVKDLAHEFILKGASENLVQEVKKKIGTWLIEHIKGQDFRWAKELKEKAPDLFKHTFKAPPPALGAAPHTAAPAAGKAPSTASRETASAGSPQTPHYTPSQGKKRSTSILAKVTVFSSLFLLAAIAVMAVLGVYNMKELARASAITITESKLQGDMTTLKNAITAAYGSLSALNGTLTLTDEENKALNGRYEVIDRIAKELNITVTIFIRDNSGFTRVITTLTDTGGARLDGRPMTSNNAAYEPLLAGKSYTGELITAGKHFIGSYEPVFEAPANTVLIGALFAGVEMSRVDSLITERSQKLILTAGVTAAALVLLSIALNFVLLKKTIINPIKKIIAVLKHVEDGDISRQINLRPGDEIGEIAGSFDRTLENLKNLVMIIRNEAEAVDEIGEDLSASMNKTAEAMNEINAAVKHIRGQITTQAGSVDTSNAAVNRIIESIYKLNDEIEIQTESVSHSSSAIEQMLASIDSVTRISRVNSDNVQRLAQASEVSRSGLQAMAADMEEIARESEGLLEINAVLENIAGQTNLLSMNAAIEAAHAGEAGRGFAVVAGEIRKLAENSGRQSKTIGDVLKKIRGMITKISGAADGVLKTFAAINADVKTVAGQEEQIRDAMEKQSSGSRQILDAVGKLKEITQTVKDSSGEMQEESRAIIAEGKNLGKATEEIACGMNEMAGRAGEVNESVKHVNAISRRNRNNIEVLREAISRFTIADNHYRWDGSLAIGVSMVDAQHMQLFESLNGLIDAIEAGRGKEELSKALDFLASYTATHFSGEEALQKQCGYPDYENHRRIHECFKETAAALTAEFAKTGNTERLVQEVKRQFGDWLITHIKGQDSRIGAHIRKTGFQVSG
jgi:hemerythrin-like metal-binding protein